MNGPYRDTCAACGVKLTGHRRRWCSERCRRTQYAGRCETCGAPTTGNRGRALAPARCAACCAGRNAQRNLEIVRLWREGRTSTEIAAELGVSAQSVMTWVDWARDRGADIPLHRARNREAWPRIERLWRDGKTQGQIGALLGISAANVAQQMKAMRRKGVDLPRRRASNRARMAAPQ